MKGLTMPQPLPALTFDRDRAQLAASFRALRAKGTPKSNIVALISKGTRSRETRKGLLQLLDQVWREEQCQ